MREDIYETNFGFVSRLLERLEGRELGCYVHAGSSSEYGDNASGPKESVATTPNSEYAVSKISAAESALLLGHAKKKFPCCNLRIYSVYRTVRGFCEADPHRRESGYGGKIPPFVDPNISRDFVYVDDVSEAFVLALR